MDLNGGKDTMETSEVWTERLDHLGIVAGVCREMGLIEEIDRMVGPTERKVSVGQATQANDCSSPARSVLVRSREAVFFCRND